MDKMNFKSVFIYLTFCLLFCCNYNEKTHDSAEVESIMVFAAASLADVISEVADSFEIKYNVSVQVNLASSGVLARQIEQGSRADVYISASKRWADHVQSLGAFQNNSISFLAMNSLVLVAPKNSGIPVARIDSSFSVKRLLGMNRLSIGDPTHVPAGKYAKQSLEYFGWYKELENRLLPAKDVRSALMVVELGEAPLGIVYKTDALKSKKVDLLGDFPQYSHEPIVYVGGVCSTNSYAKLFLEYMSSENIKVTWERYGFLKE